MASAGCTRASATRWASSSTTPREGFHDPIHDSSRTAARSHRHRTRSALGSRAGARSGADGAFVYAVKTTGVYCLPSSPSRLPHPANVEFFDNAAAAEAAGYRPSRRAAAPALAELHAAIVADACRRIEAADTLPTLPELASAAGISPYHFHRLFKAATGLTPRAYAAAHRAKKLREQLGTSDSVTEAIYDAGFGSNSRFYETSDAVLGMTPSRYRAGGADTDIRFAIGQCSLGAILVAQSGRGVCAILLGDDPQTLLQDLQDQFPRAT